MNRSETYRKWHDEFVGKHIGGRKITDIEVLGPPSFVYGSIKVILEDGEMYAPQGSWQYRPPLKEMRKLIDEYKEGKP